MKLDCRENVISNDYMDFIIEFSKNLDLQPDRYEELCVQSLGSEFGIAYKRIDSFSKEQLETLPYALFPHMYGLQQENGADAANAVRLQLQPNLQLKGQGTLIGIIDTGIDYTHKAFRYSNGDTRVNAIWDQSVNTGEPPEGYVYGTEYNKSRINEALRSEDPYSVVDSQDTIGHGTFLAGVAAGNADLQNDFVGVAPQAEIVVVKLKEAKQNMKDYFFIKEGAIAYQENDIMAALQYLVDYGTKQGMPISICLGLGTNQGNHGGGSPLAAMLNSYATRIGVGISVAGGNEGNKRHHFQGSISDENEYEEVEINVSQGEKGFTLELWGTSPEIYSVGFVTPNGEVISRMDATTYVTNEVRFLFSPTIIYIDYSIAEPRTGNQVIEMRFEAPEPGIWRIRVYGQNLIGGLYNMWLPIQAFTGEDTFFVKSTPFTTLTEPSNATNVMSVAGYNSIQDAIFVESGRGYSTTGYINPSFAAPAFNIIGPDLNNGYTVKSGTSIAAAITTGVAAQFLTWGIVYGNQDIMRTTDIKNFLVRGAKREPRFAFPNEQWGYGTLDAYNAFAVLV